MMKKLGLTAICAAVLVSGVFASSGAEKSKSGAGAAGGTVYIPLISKGFQHQFWQAVKQGADQAAKEFGIVITFEGPESESQVDKQIEMLQTALGKKPAALGIAALDSQSAIPLLQQAQKSNIPVIAFDSGVDSDIPLATVSTNNIVAAGVAADKMAEAIGGSGKVAVIVHDQTSRTGIDRRDGFVNRIKEKYPGIELLEVQYGGGDHLRSTEIAKAVINGNPDLKGYFGSNEGSAIGVVNAVTELGLQGKITVIGYDSGKLQIDAIRSGLMYGAVQQNPVLMGYKTVEWAFKATKGEKPPAKVIDSGYVWADKSNIDSAEVKAVIYE
ncbi:MAG: ABC transporter substrate-binding protein [Spirochaetaceae bacterium]|jgi:ribose transport system substrate-binding protein|nr:ABC transporter substrate-binding protein [Spirochaetaceae bacterium]